MEITDRDNSTPLGLVRSGLAYVNRFHQMLFVFNPSKVLRFMVEVLVNRFHRMLFVFNPSRVLRLVVEVSVKRFHRMLFMSIPLRGYKKSLKSL